MISKRVSQIHPFSSLARKKAQMQMSVGTIVTIVLLMTVLVLGLVLTRTIFTGSIENINSIDQSVKNEINKLFSEDSNRRVVVYPPTREIFVKKGEQGGLGFSIRNINTGSNDPTTFSYSVSFIESSCGISSQQAEDLITIGKSGSNLNIPQGLSLDNPVLVRFSISENTPLCTISYGINIQNNGQAYGSTTQIILNVQAN